MLAFIEKNRQKALELDRETIFRLVADSGGYPSPRIGAAG